MKKKGRGKNIERRKDEEDRGRKEEGRKKVRQEER